MPELQATCRESLPRVIPPANTRPIRGFSQDESRFGWLTVRRRRVTAWGIHPVGASSTSSTGALSTARWRRPPVSTSY
jgi:hypothetical protein